MLLNSEQIAALETLANGIIPADERDAGAECVKAGARLADKIAAGINSRIYMEGLAAAQNCAKTNYGLNVSKLNSQETHTLLSTLKETQPPFFRQLRADVAALYLGDSAVWQRIGFPGPSTSNGGYPDFDQPQERI